MDKNKWLTPEEIEIECLDESRNDKSTARLCSINREFKQGFEFIESYKDSVSFFGSARFTEENEHYIDALDLAYKIVNELDFIVVTGGGPGIMEAANKGAKEAGGISLGLPIRLKNEENVNKYVTDAVRFNNFSARKTTLTYAASAYIFYPGGFGTLDELFEILTLTQTNKIPKAPIFLMGSDYWGPMDKFIRENVLELHEAIDKTDVNIYKVLDTHEEVLDAIRKHKGELSKRF
ncbi:TIGR00730 family Rossman fold protein [Candidatus Nomurabacteria bacterium]|nr:MAG: TIGR00730 family Rossman fold protein [Candidatus Nomurabacteria bacterium]